MEALLVGKEAPDFSLKDATGKTHSMKDIETEFIVLFFYPKDNTPGCSIEANEFNKHLKDFSKISATVVGISGGDEKSKEKFCRKLDLTLLLLSDTDFSVSTAYGCYKKKSFMGKSYMGISRETFVIGPDRKVLIHYPKVNPLKHAKEVLVELRNFVK